MSSMKSPRLEKVPDSECKEAYHPGVMDSNPLSDRRSGYLSQWWSEDLLERQDARRTRRM